MSLSGHNCNLCKKTTIITQIGTICLGEKYRGKVIEEDDAICDEYEFGGFIELSERLSKIRKQVKELREYSDYINTCGTTHFKSIRLMNEAADTIESLYIKSESTICDSAWIPCKDKLPEEKINPITNDFYEYQVTYKNGDVADIRHYKFGDNHWWNSGQNMDKYVVAWRELPQVYEEVEDD